MIRNNEITKNCLFYSTTSATIKGYDSLRNLYTKAIDTSLRKQIDSLIEIDQHYTRKVNDGFILTRYTYHAIRWLRNNKKQVEILKKIIEEKGYPGEKIIGLPLSMSDSIHSSNRFNKEGPWLRETHAYIMFIHYYSNPRPDLNNTLVEQIMEGNLVPYQFGAFNDFLARWGKKGTVQLTMMFGIKTHIEPMKQQFLTEDIASDLIRLSSKILLKTLAIADGKTRP